MNKPYKLSRNERIRIAAAFMVDSVDYITLSAIADNLFVSRATIIEDLNEIKEFIRKSGLEVISSPNKGQRVVGKESDKRLFLLRLLEKEDAAAGRENPAFSVQAGNKIMIQKIVNEQEHVHNCYLDDASFRMLHTYLGIMVSQNMKGEYVEPQAPSDSPRYRMAQDILKYICQYCQPGDHKDRNPVHHHPRLRGSGAEKEPGDRVPCGGGVPFRHRHLPASHGKA